MPFPYELGRYDTTLLIEDPITGNTRPAAASVIDIYREGADVSAPTSIPGSGGSGPISVYDTGAIRVGDELFKNTVTGTRVTVSALTATTITVSNANAGAFGVDAGNRLIPFTNRLVHWLEERGVGASSSQLVADARGKIRSYGQRFDGIASGGLITSAQLMLEQTPIGGEDVIDPRKFGARCDGTTDDTAAMQACLAYAAAVASTGPRKIVLPGIVRVTEKLTVVESVIIEGLHQFAGFSQATAGQILLEVAAAVVTLTRCTLLREAGTARLLDVLATGINFTARDLLLFDTTAGTGIRTLADGGLYENLDWQTTGAASLFLIDGNGGANQRFGTTVRGLRAGCAAIGVNGVTVQNGAKHVLLDKLNINAFTLGVHDVKGITVTANGTIPENIIISNSVLTAGYVAEGILVANGYGVRVVNVTAADCKDGFGVYGGQEALFIGATAVGSRQAGWLIAGGGAVSLVGCVSSDVSQGAANTHPHVSIGTGKDDVYITGLSLGNHIRHTSVDASHGVRFVGGTVSRGTVRDVKLVQGLGTSGVNGDLIDTTAATVNPSVDISHNGTQKDRGASPMATMDHPGFAGATRVDNAGTNLNFDSIAVLELTGAGRTFTTVSSPATKNSGHRILVCNTSANTMILNNIPGSLLNIGAANLSLLTLQKVEYVLINGAYRQIAAPAAGT